MTIAAGFRCGDGVLLCADRQWTHSFANKYGHSKILRLAGSKNAVFYTFAGDVDYSVMCIELLIERMHKAELAGKSVLDEVRLAARQIHARYSPLGGHEPYELEALMVLHIDEAVLLKIRGPIVRHVDQMECIGSGMFLARAVASSLYSPEMQLREGYQMAAYVLGQAKKHVDGCGEGSDIVGIYDTDAWHEMPREDVTAAELRYEQFLAKAKADLLSP